MERHRLADHVQNCEWETEFISQGSGIVIHKKVDPEAPSRARRVSERWANDYEPLGSGGQGEVYLQTCISNPLHLTITRRVVKRIPFTNGSARQRFVDELVAVMKFTHEQYSNKFVQTLGWYKDKTNLYIAMEYLPTGDLYAYVQNHDRLSEDDTREITAQVLEGLEVMHDQGFAHRDLKPRNILINQCPSSTARLWKVKIADFGLSKRLAVAGETSTAVLGTRLYMAPELWMGSAKSIDWTFADTWALGVVVFYLRTKTEPFPRANDMIDYFINPDEKFPRQKLGDCGVSNISQGFIKALLNPEPTDRLSAKEARRNGWFNTMPVLEPSHPVTSVQSSTAQNIASPPQDHLLDIRNSMGVRTMEDRDVDGNTPLSRAIFIGNENYVRRLLRQNVSLESKNTDGDTPLMIAAICGNLVFVELLIVYGANINSDAVNGCTPLFRAAEHGQPDIAAFLIDHGANKEAKGGSGNTPLMEAAWQGHKAVTELLLQSGADIAAKRQKDGNTALHLAASNAQTSTAKVLLDRRAEVNATNKMGETALHSAAHPSMLTGEKRLETRVQREPVARLLIERGADVKAFTVDEHGNGHTPLHKAIVDDNPGIVEILLDNGADVNQQTRGYARSTPLTLAEFNGLKDMRRILTKRGAKKTVESVFLRGAAKMLGN